MTGLLADVLAVYGLGALFLRVEASCVEELEVVTEVDEAIAVEVGSAFSERHLDAKRMRFSAPIEPHVAP